MDIILYLKVQTILLVVIAAINFIFATLILLRDKKKSSLFFIGAIVSVSLWSLGLGIYVTPGISDMTFFLSKWNYVWGGLIGVFFMFFGLHFGIDERKISKWIYIVTGLISLSISAIVLLPAQYALIVREIVEVNNIKIEHFGSLYPFYMLYVLGFFSIGFASLIRRFFKSTGIFRKQLLYVIAGTSLSTIFAVATNIILPYFLQVGILVWLGPVGTLFMIVGIFYAITRHGLWDFKVVATEISLLILIIILLIETLLADTVSGQILKGSVFFMMSLFSFFLVKGMIVEVESRERIERLAENLSAANRRLQDLDVEKSDFVSIASHQLRTPLTVIKGYASMLLEGSFGAIKEKGQHEAIDKIYQASQRLVLMIEDFLNISRIEKGEMVYNMARLDFRELVEEVISELSMALSSEKLDLMFDSPKDVDFYITGDHLKLRQVISNIIDNSIKYTPPGGHINVQLSKDPKIGRIVFSVRDTGVGMTKEAIDKLFQKFSRAKGMSKLHTEGRGLGLYVAKQIVEAHGGEVSAYSKGENMGSTFTVTLPDFEREKERREIKSFIQEL